MRLPPRAGPPWAVQAFRGAALGLLLGTSAIAIACVAVGGRKTVLLSRDIRYKAPGQTTARAAQVWFPLQVRVNRASAELALAEARRVIEQVREAAGQLDLPGAKLDVAEPGSAQARPTDELTIEQASKREVRLQLLFSVMLSFPTGGDFWAKAAAIARTADFLQSVLQQPREKDTDLEVLQASLLGRTSGGKASAAEEAVGQGLDPGLGLAQNS